MKLKGISSFYKEFAENDIDVMVREATLRAVRDIFDTGGVDENTLNELDGIVWFLRNYINVCNEINNIYGKNKNKK